MFFSSNSHWDIDEIHITLTLILSSHKTKQKTPQVLAVCSSEALFTICTERRFVCSTKALLLFLGLALPVSSWLGPSRRHMPWLTCLHVVWWEVHEPHSAMLADHRSTRDYIRYTQYLCREPCTDNQLRACQRCCSQNKSQVKVTNLKFTGQKSPARSVLKSLSGILLFIIYLFSFHCIHSNVTTPGILVND